MMTVLLLFALWMGCVDTLSPSMLPERVVEMQLRAFQESDIRSAFRFASPANQEATGPWQRFASLLSSPPFDPIVAHKRANVLMTISHGANFNDGTCCLVRIVPGEQKEQDDEEDEERTISSSPCLLYWWELSRQYENGPNKGCFMVDSVVPDWEDMELDMMDLLEDEGDDYLSFFDIE